MFIPSLSEIARQRELLKGNVIETPVWWWRGVNAPKLVGAQTQVFLKLELFQFGGSFKPRGALTVMQALDLSSQERGVTAVSAGNHAIAVAYAAHLLGMTAKVVMPSSANRARIERCRALGAEVELVVDVHRAFERVQEIQLQEGRTFVHLAGFASILERVVGAQPLTINEMPCFAGLVRIVNDGTAIFPHNDDLRDDVPLHPVAQALGQLGGGQLAFNLYLSTADQGGDLEMWPRKPLAEEYETKRMAGSSYGLDPTLLEEPALRLTPLPGELIIFDSTKLHAVTEAKGGTRVSISFFLGITPDLQAYYWS